MRTDVQPADHVAAADAMLHEVDYGLAFHHMGVACHDLDREHRQFEALGYVAEGTDFFDPHQGVHGRFLIGGGPRIELLRNQSEPGVLTPWLRKGIRFYHMAYEVNDFAAQTRAFEQRGGKQVVAPVPAVAFGGRLICFYMMPNMTLIELVSRT